MNKRIIISESEKKRILSQHKQTIQNESDLKKQSLSERELSKLVNRILINEQSEDIKEITDKSCKSNSDCPTGQRCVSGKCQITTSLKESGPCKSNSDCPPNMACYNGKCSITTSSKEMKEASTKPTGASKIPGCPPFTLFCPPANTCCPRGTKCTMQGCKPLSGPTMPGVPPMNEEIDEIIYEIEFDEESYTEMDEDTDARNCCRRGCRGTSEICQNCRCVPRVTWSK